jgi:hypothetical protein
VCARHQPGLPERRDRPDHLPGADPPDQGNIGTLAGGTNPSVSLYFTARG